MLNTTTYICYKITNISNGKIYIGQTIQSLEARWKQHLGYASWKLSTTSNIHVLHEAIKQEGVDNFSIEQIGSASSSEEINKMEKFFINLYNCHHSNGYGYNMTSGGGGTVGYKFTDADRLKMSLAHKGRSRGPMSEETKQKISEIKKHKGHGPSELCRRRRSELGKGKKHSPEARAKIVEAHQNRSPESRAKQAASLKKRWEERRANNGH